MKHIVFLLAVSSVVNLYSGSSKKMTVFSARKVAIDTTGDTVRVELEKPALTIYHCYLSKTRHKLQKAA